MENYWILHRSTFDILSNAERFVLAYIEQFSKKDKSCGASQEYIADRMRIGRSTVKRSIQNLKKHKLIIVHEGKRCARNSYDVNYAALKSLIAKWEKEMRTIGRERLKETLRIKDSWLQALKPSTACILVANLYQVQESAADKLGVLSEGVMYSQSDLAFQCGCDKDDTKSIRNTIKALAEKGIISIEESNLEWRKSRKCYILHECNIGKNEPSLTGKMNLEEQNNPDENTDTNPEIKDFQQDFMPIGKNEPSISGKMNPDYGKNEPSLTGNISPNEYIMNTFMNTEMNTAVFPEEKAACDSECEKFSDLSDEPKQIAFMAMKKERLSRLGF